MKKYIQTFEEYIGDKVSKWKRGTHKEVLSIDTNTKGKHYDQEDDGSDQINRSTIQRYSPAEK